MTRPFSEAFDYRSDSVEEDVPLPDGRDRLPLAGQEGEIPRNDDNDPVPCEDRELLPEEEAVLADFVGHSRVIAEWCIRHPEIRFKARELHALIEADTPARRSNFFYKANHQMQHHRVLGPYWFWQGSSGAREYWLDSGWRHSDTPKGLRKEDVAANDTVGRTALAGVTRRGGAAGRPLAPPSCLPKAPEAPDISQWYGRRPSQRFEEALRDGAAMEAPLSERGLKLVYTLDERHLFVGDWHIDLPVMTMDMVHILALHPEGLTEEGFQRGVRRYLALDMVKDTVAAHLRLMEHQLEGTGTLRRMPLKDGRTAYRLEGAFPPIKDGSSAGTGCSGRRYL